MVGIHQYSRWISAAWLLGLCGCGQVDSSERGERTASESEEAKDAGRDAPLLDLDASNVRADAAIENAYVDAAQLDAEVTEGDCDAEVCGASVTDDCGTTERCGNGADDDCDGQVDEACPCVVGAVQPCFLGPPGRRSVGACMDGTQRCIASGEFGRWDACKGGTGPSHEVCDQLDNDCNGCADDMLCCGDELSCPAPDDIRIAPGSPFVPYPLKGADFYSGEAASWRWAVEGGPCDEILPSSSFTTAGLDSKLARFTPTLSGDYRVKLDVTTVANETLSCEFVVHVAGPGLRVELCWANSTANDLDLYLHEPMSTEPWYSGTYGHTQSTTTDDSCNWSNCSGALRGHSRIDWGYADSPLSHCEHGPLGADFQALGHCPNPRLDVDNNQMLASGTAENISVDNPRDGESFRIMVQNFSGTQEEPIVNVYCGGRRAATIGAAPDKVPGFTGPHGGTSVGAMWRVADVQMEVDGSGVTTDCDVDVLHPPGEATGYHVTVNDPSY